MSILCNFDFSRSGWPWCNLEGPLHWAKVVRNPGFDAGLEHAGGGRGKGRWILWLYLVSIQKNLNV
jgi:hypothetical protein